LKMFSVRLAARCARLSTVIPSTSRSRAVAGARAVPSVTRIPRVSTPSFFGLTQKRFYEDLADDDSVAGQRYSVRHRAPDGAPLQPTDTLYVGNMQFDVSEEDLYNYFSSVGEVKGVKVIMDPRGLSKGFGYVQYSNLDNAIKACTELNNSIFGGRRLNVQFLAKPQANRMNQNAPSKTLFIGNMNYEMTDDDISDLFKGIKNCLDVRVAMDRRTGQPRGFAHADFVDVDSAVAAKEKLSGRIFFGRALRIDFAAGEARDRPSPQNPMHEDL